jgi:hypothetical protein
VRESESESGDNSLSVATVALPTTHSPSAEVQLDRKGWHSAQHGTDVTFEPRRREADVSGAMFTLHTLAGFHLIEIRATDANGNRDVEPAAYEWVVY